MITKKGFTKIISHDPWGRGSCAGAWPYKSYSKNAFLFKMIFSTPRHRTDKLCISKEGSTYQKL